MGISVAEATKSLLCGTKLSWKKFEDHKGGSVTLNSAGARRLFQFLLKQDSTKVAAPDEILFQGLIAAWNNNKNDPATEFNVNLLMHDR